MTTVKDIYDFNNPKVTHIEDELNARLNIVIDFPNHNNAKRVLRITKEIPLYYKAKGV
jgi:hypothetical protein